MGGPLQGGYSNRNRESCRSSDHNIRPVETGYITVEQAWGRVTRGASKTGTIYLTIHNTSSNDDLLLAVDSINVQTTAIMRAALSTALPVWNHCQWESHCRTIAKL